MSEIIYYLYLSVTSMLAGMYIIDKYLDWKFKDK
jgi:hypothetical protein